VVRPSVVCEQQTPCPMLIPHIGGMSHESEGDTYLHRGTHRSTLSWVEAAGLVYNSYCSVVVAEIVPIRTHQFTESHERHASRDTPI